MGRRYLDLLEADEEVIAKDVTDNLYAPQSAPVFIGGGPRVLISGVVQPIEPIQKDPPFGRLTEALGASVILR